MDTHTGEIVGVHVLVVTLPYIGHLFGKGYRNETMEHFFDGVTPIVISDNCATAVDKKTSIISTRYTWL